MIEIDASYGEAGGQMLRLAVAYSMILGKPFRMRNIRVGRPKPGLKNQHLHILKTAYNITGREFHEEVGQTEVEFHPGKVVEKRIDVDMKTAASITLFFQALMPVFIMNSMKGRVVGGTDVKFSPTMDYFIHVLLPFYRKFGDVKLDARRRGYYPRGGGLVEFSTSFSLDERKIEISDWRVEKERIIISSSRILESKGICERAKEMGADCRYYPSLDPGGSVLVLRKHASHFSGADGLFEKGKKLEEIVEYVRKKEDVNLQDNLVFFLSLFGGKAFIGNPTSHTESAIYVARHFSSDISFSKGWLNASPMKGFIG